VSKKSWRQLREEGWRISEPDLIINNGSTEYIVEVKHHGGGADGAPPTIDVLHAKYVVPELKAGLAQKWVLYFASKSVKSAVKEAAWLIAQQNRELSRLGAAVTPPPVPPAAAGKLLALVCDPQMGEALLGDLDEKFHELVHRFGPRFAARWYWWQALRSLGFLLAKWAWRLMKLEAVVRRIL